MDDRLLLGRWHAMIPIPPMVWRRQVRGDAQLDFMSEEHHNVRNHVVRDMMPKL